MYNSFGVTCNNFQIRLSVRHSVSTSPTTGSTAHSAPGKEGLTSQGQDAVTWRTAGNTMHYAPKDVIQSLAYTLLLCGTFPVEITAGPK